MFIVCVLGDMAFSQEDAPPAIISFDEFKTQMDAEEGVVVYNFWATWCKPCVEEIPYFESINKSYKKKGVKVVLVSLDFKRQYYLKMIPFVEDNKLKSEVVLLDVAGDNSFIDKISPDWGGSIPATLIVHNPSDTYKFLEEQFTSEEQIEAILNPILDSIKGKK